MRDVNVILENDAKWKFISEIGRLGFCIMLQKHYVCGA